MLLMEFVVGALSEDASTGVTSAHILVAGDTPVRCKREGDGEKGTEGDSHAILLEGPDVTEEHALIRCDSSSVVVIPQKGKVASLFPPDTPQCETTRCSSMANQQSRRLPSLMASVSPSASTIFFAFPIPQN